MNSDMEQVLWNYIDNALDTAERKKVEQLIQTSTEWGAGFYELQQLNNLLQKDLSLEKPSMRFTKNVVDEISKLSIAPAAKNYINKKLIAGIAAFFIVTICALLFSAMLRVNWTAAGSETLPDISKLNLSDYFNKPVLNVFLMMNVVLALILVDRLFSPKKINAT